jgi:non-canonical (house-cleaning) NTP pyrophosphatase
VFARAHADGVVLDAGSTPQIHGHAADSGIPHGQPWGMQHTFEGALARIASLKDAAQVHGSPSQHQDWAYIVSVENGVCSLLSHQHTFAVDVCCVVIEHVASGTQRFSFSQSRPYPLSEVQAKLRCGEKDIGKWCSKYYEQLSLPESRSDQVTTATRMALAQLHAALRDGADSATAHAATAIVPSGTATPTPPRREKRSQLLSAVAIIAALTCMASTSTKEARFLL